MVAIASRITIGQDEATISALVSGSVPDDFVEHTRQADRISVRTISGHDEIGKGKVVFVILAVQVLAIPAGRKHELQAQAICAVRVKVSLFREKVAIQSALGVPGVVEAVEAHSTLRQNTLRGLAKACPLRLWWIRLTWVTSGVGSSVITSRNHSKSLGESGDVISI